MHEREMMKEALDELKGACEYAKCAMKHRESDPAAAKKYYEMAMDELRHADNFYRMAGENMSTKTYTELETAYIDGDKEEYAEEYAKAKAILDSYRGG